PFGLAYVLVHREFYLAQFFERDKWVTLQFPFSSDPSRYAISSFFSIQNEKVPKDEWPQKHVLVPVGNAPVKFGRIKGENGDGSRWLIEDADGINHLLPHQFLILSEGLAELLVDR
ncbi:MAG TPA: hypothetical protein VFV38_06835, partial [Ktedonobacteraceae bacterium]|nr:hypothetical protein [Ktedonobacteraceae bacterium]